MTEIIIARKPSLPVKCSQCEKLEKPLSSPYYPIYECSYKNACFFGFEFNKFAERLSRYNAASWED